MSILGLDITFVVGGQEGKDGLRRLSVAFERAGAALENFGHFVWPGLEKALEAAEAEQFDAEGGGPTAGRWAPLSPRYAKWKAQRYPGAPIMVREGNLRAALTDSSSPFALRASSDAELVFGSQGVPYASHASARRPVFDFGESLEDSARAAAAAGIRQALKQELEQLVDISDASGEYMGGA